MIKCAIKKEKSEDKSNQFFTIIFSFYFIFTFPKFPIQMTSNTIVLSFSNLFNYMLLKIVRYKVHFN